MVFRDRFQFLGCPVCDGACRHFLFVRLQRCSARAAAIFALRFVGSDKNLQIVGSDLKRCLRWYGRERGERTKSICNASPAAVSRRGASIESLNRRRNACAGRPLGSFDGWRRTAGNYLRISAKAFGL